MAWAIMGPPKDANPTTASSILPVLSPCGPLNCLDHSLASLIQAGLLASPAGPCIVLSNTPAIPATVSATLLSSAAPNLVKVSWLKKSLSSSSSSQTTADSSICGDVSHCTPCSTTGSSSQITSSGLIGIIYAPIRVFYHLAPIYCSGLNYFFLSRQPTGDRYLFLLTKYKVRNT